MFILIISVIWFAILSILTLILLPIGLLVGVFSKKARDYYCLFFVQFALRSILFTTRTKDRTTIIPVCMNNSGEAFENVLPHMHKSRICAEFLEPIEIKDMSQEELDGLPEKIRDMIYERIIENGKEIGSIPPDYVRPEESEGFGNN